MAEDSFLFSRINPRFLLVGSRALAALRPSLIAFLSANEKRLSGGKEHSIEFCNVLFVGNLCASLFIGFKFGFNHIIKNFLLLDNKLRWGLLINGCFSALLSALIFSGIEYTSVTNAVLLGRLGPVLYALAGSVILGRKVIFQEWLGFSLIAVGIIFLVLKTSHFQINIGDLLILASTFVYAISSILGKTLLSGSVRLPLVVFARNFISAIVFFIIASTMFGFQHFADVFAGHLWIIMSIYALIAIVLEQFLWYAALEKLESIVVGRWTSISPVFGILYAFILNNERPSSIQISAFFIIMIGLFISALGKSVTKKEEKIVKEEIEMAQTADSTASF
ncbi:MAG: DMT family transporter [Crocosphaera sp.]|jgi:drug/metabolite transporter (DMT)-like permease